MKFEVFGQKALGFHYNFGRFLIEYYHASDRLSGRFAGHTYTKQD
jgi:hypothetical protein